jgi:serine/threonine protein kinase
MLSSNLRASPVSAGTRLGPYEILSRLKSGGMATLYLARRSGASGFKRHVAIKVIHDHLAADASLVRMFVDEALVHARIHHPNVAHVEELVHHQGQYFLVMEYVHGCSLARLMSLLGRQDRALTPEVATHIAMHVAAGLHGAHEACDDQGRVLGVVHRDVSPQNVQLAYDGHVKLIDFGVAKVKSRGSTLAGALKGKLRYMSPEQAVRGGEIDRRADVYALGIVLWEMLTARECFPGDSDLAVLELVRDPQVRPPSELRAGIPPALDAAVMKALAPEPADRFQSAQEMRRALVDAVPAASLIDAADLAALLTAVMPDEVERDQKQLRAAISRVMPHLAAREASTAEEAGAAEAASTAERAEGALESMTIIASAAHYASDGAAAAPATPTPAHDSGERSSGAASGAPEHPGSEPRARIESGPRIVGPEIVTPDADQPTVISFDGEPPVAARSPDLGSGPVFVAAPPAAAPAPPRRKRGRIAKVMLALVALTAVVVGGLVMWRGGPLPLLAGLGPMRASPAQPAPPSAPPAPAPRTAMPPTAMPPTATTTTPTPTTPTPTPTPTTTPPTTTTTPTTTTATTPTATATATALSGQAPASTETPPSTEAPPSQGSAALAATGASAPTEARSDTAPPGAETDARRHASPRERARRAMARVASESDPAVRSGSPRDTTEPRTTSRGGRRPVLLTDAF